MDQTLPEYSGNPIVVTGVGIEVPASVLQWFEAGAPDGWVFEASLTHDADPLAFLRVRKTVKFMSKQDRLAMSAAALAVRSAGLAPEVLDEQTMIAMCVGPIPFQKGEALEVAENSRAGNDFSMERFCRDAYEAVNPMLLFACLPNMPAYHISANLGVRGGYCLTYPSCTESYGALRKAVDVLNQGRAKAVIFGGVADQQNFLVQHHYRKTGQCLAAPDCAGFVILESLNDATARNAKILARLEALRHVPGLGGNMNGKTCYFGAAELPVEVAHFINGQLGLYTHHHVERENLFESVWSR